MGDIPRAIFLSIAVTTMLYVWVSLAVTSLAPPDELARSEAPLALAIESVWPRAGNTLGAIAIFSTANTVLISLIAGSRLAYSRWNYLYPSVTWKFSRNCRR